MKTGIELIAVERQRQIEEEGFDAERDDQYTGGELAQAAASYTVCCHKKAPWQQTPIGWPWASAWWKWSTDPIHNLEKAGALIAAEIDRLQRLKTKD